MNPKKVLQEISCSTFLNSAKNLAKTRIPCHDGLARISYKSMRFKIHKNRQKTILKITVIVGFFAWILIGAGFYSLEKKHLANKQKKFAIETIERAGNLPETISNTSVETVAQSVSDEPKQPS
jgi:hypothetical protein